MQLKDVLDKVKIGDPLQWENLQVFPLTQPDGHAPGYALLDDLLERQQIEITELADGASVPRIQVRNRGDQDALILDGTELHGAKQNRMVNITIVVGKRSEAPIPVSCVERGRWSYRSHGFASSKRTVASKLRNRKAHMVAESLARHKQAATDQGRVWDDVDHYLGAAKATSSTASFDDAYRQSESSWSTYVDHLQHLDAHGAIVAIHGQVIALDLVDHRDTFKKLWAGLLRGYAFDAALEGGAKRKQLDRAEVEAWLRTTAANAIVAPQEVGGVAQYYSVTGTGHAGNGLAGGVTVHDGRAIHVALFPVAD
jgi:hypothetical protein